MSDPLDSIITALQTSSYEVGQHVWDNFIENPGRPLPSAIVESIADNEPHIVEDYPDDQRGRSCKISGTNGDGRTIESVVGYERSPIKIVTGWYKGR